MKHTLFLSILIFSSALISSCQPAPTRLFVGGFTKQPGEKGMSIFDFTADGEMNLVSQSDVGPNPSYFCFSTGNNLLYVANEVNVFNGTRGGGLTTYKYSEEFASLEKQNEMAIPYGGPCFISMSPDSGFLFLANYPNGSVVTVRLDDDGIPEAIADTILYVRDNPRVSHAHMILNDPSGKKIFVTDLGLNRIIIYNFDTNAGKLIPVDTLMVPNGFGPRHFDFSRDGSMLYLINELGSKITVFSLKGEEPELIQTLSTLREGFDKESFCADIHMSQDGKYIYGSNRGENTIVTFAVQSDGTLKLTGHTPCGGNWPRKFVLDPSGRFLLVGNQRSDSVAVFRLDKKNGLPLEPARKYKVTAPVCLKFY